MILVVKGLLVQPMIGYSFGCEHFGVAVWGLERGVAATVSYIIL